MRRLTKYLVKYDKNFTLPKCHDAECSCFDPFQLTVNCRTDNPLSYLVKVESLIKKYKIAYDTHYRLACLKLCKNSGVPGFVLLDIIREHFTTLSVFQDFLESHQNRENDLEGVAYILHLRTVFKKYSYVKRQMKELLHLFKKICKDKMYPKMYFDTLSFYHLHTTKVFKKSVVLFEIG